MTLGNLMALQQIYGKRLLGYSSVAHLGYVLLALGLGLAYGRPEPISAALFMIAAHAAMKGLAFLAKGTFHLYCDASLIAELDGMLHRLPLTTVCFVVALTGLAAVPPLAGFAAKWHILVGAVGIGHVGAGLCAVAFLVNSLISLGYYLPLIGRVIRSPEAALSRPIVSPWMRLPMIALAVLVVLVGIIPGPLMRLSQEGGAFLLKWGPR